MFANTHAQSTLILLPLTRTISHSRQPDMIATTVNVM